MKPWSLSGALSGSSGHGQKGTTGGHGGEGGGSWRPTRAVLGTSSLPTTLPGFAASRTVRKQVYT